MVFRQLNPLARFTCVLGQTEAPGPCFCPALEPNQPNHSIIIILAAKSVCFFEIPPFRPSLAIKMMNSGTIISLVLFNLFQI